MKDLGQSWDYDSGKLKLHLYVLFTMLLFDYCYIYVHTKLINYIHNYHVFLYNL